MVRRVANQVHKQAARLLRSDYIKREPAWYRAVLDHPPLPLPPRAPPARPSDDRLPADREPRVHPKRAKETRAPRPLPVYYLEDDVRRQFFRDHPFEAFRPRSLAEGARVEDEHPIRGAGWTRLAQRGRNPSPEDAVRFAVNLHTAHDVPLSKAYASAVAQFRALRGEAQIAAAVAAAEAEAYGGTFGPTEVERAFEKEAEALQTWQRAKDMDEGALAARKRWRAIVDRAAGTGEWTRGEQYTRLWKEGVRPNYALTEPVAEAAPGVSAPQFIPALQR